MKRKGTYVTLKGRGGRCPRCGENTYGYMSETEAYEEGKLKAKYKMRKKFCTYCAYVEGDALN